MPRLRNTKSGAVVSVRDEKADALLAGEWEPADKQAPKATAKKASSSSKNEK